MFRGLAKTGLLILPILALSTHGFAQPAEGPRFPQTPQSPMPQSRGLGLESLRPSGADYSADSLRRFHQAFQSQFGPSAREVPLEAKAEYLEWVLTRYHWTPFHQINPRVTLPDQPGSLPAYQYGADTSTWNGTYLGALSYKYAVTKSPETLQKIGRLLDGMHLFLEVTGKLGLPARCVLQEPIAECNVPYTAPNGQKFFYRSDAAKGTLNQIIGGYCVMMMLVWPDLPPDTQRMAQDDLHAMAYHLVGNEYRLTERDGKRTEYGDIRPLIGSQSVPFNAQVAYMVVATGAYFPGRDPNAQRQIQSEFIRLREKHHVYYEKPSKTWLPLILPQRVGDNPLVKGMNDRNHVLNAAYWGLMLEQWSARREGRRLHGDFCYELGQTMFWTMQNIQNDGNALCSLMWAGILSDPEMFAHIAKDNPNATRHQVAWLNGISAEQLRRFPVDRFFEPGEEEIMPTAQWIDARKKHDAYLWKADANKRWKPNGETSPIHIASLDFLHAYWLMRYWKLDADAANR